MNWLCSLVDVGKVTDCSGEGTVVSNEPEYQNAKLNSSFELVNISVLSWNVGKLRRNKKNHDFKNFCSKFDSMFTRDVGKVRWTFR